MKEEQKSRLLEAGIDINNLMDLFLNNTNLILSCLKDFLADPNYQALETALQIGDCPAAFQAAHALKGVCGNLSINSLLPLVSRQVESLRQGDLEAAARIMPELSAEYDRVVGILRSL